MRRKQADGLPITPPNRDANGILPQAIELTEFLGRVPRLIPGRGNRPSQGDHIMKKALAFAAMFLLATPALAAPDEPVKAIMDLASQLWSDKPPEGKDY